MASTCVNSKQNYSKPRRYCTRRGVLQIHRHLHGPIFAERERSHEVPNRRLERHCVDCRLPWALPLRAQRFDHLEIESDILIPSIDALPLKAEVDRSLREVRFVPIADISAPRSMSALSPKSGHSALRQENSLLTQ